VSIGGRELTAGQLLERLGFSSRRSGTPVGDLSGGEKRRLQLLRLLMAEPNLLLLDEPTNDLDTDTLAEVEDTLDGWPGTLVVVSHDRYLLERVCDRQYALLGDGAIRDLPGGVEQYLQLRHSRPASAPSSPGSGGGALGADGHAQTPAAGTGGSSGSSEAGSPASPADVRAARKDMQRLERQIAKLTAIEDRLHGELAIRATDHEAVLELDRELKAIMQQREALEEEWLAAAELAE
jgi:ABC-type multidrug transport system ATPase subunit